MSESVSINAVATSFTVIEHMATASTPLGVSDIARLMDTGRPLVYRHLRTLVELGYVAQDPLTEKYMLTPRLFHIGQAVAEQNDFLSAARRIMPDLAGQVKMTVSVSQVETRGVRVLDILRHRSTIEITTPPGTLFGFHSSAQGRIALAFCPDLFEKRVASKNLQVWSGNTVTSLESLVAELEKIKKQGWAVSSEEVLIGITALAAPVFDGHGALAGTIAIVGSTQTLEAKPDPEIVSSVVAAAQKISQQLGYRERKSAS